MTSEHACAGTDTLQLLYDKSRCADQFEHTCCRAMLAIPGKTRRLLSKKIAMATVAYNTPILLSTD